VDGRAAGELSERGPRANNNEIMTTPRLQMTIAAWLLIVASVAVVIWLFRLGALWGILGLSVLKHVVIAYLCQVLGVDRRALPGPAPGIPASPLPPASPTNTAPR
jgi:hypothetical protein